MGEIVITEFMARSAVDDLAGEFAAFVPAADPALAAVRRVPDLGGLRETAEVVSLPIPLDRTTRRLIDRATLAIARVKSGAILINAALDVFEEEPPGRAALARLAGRPNLILTPHIAGPTQESGERVAASTVAQVREVLRGA